MELKDHKALYKFDYKFNREVLLDEAKIKDGYEPFVDPLTKKKINDWMIKHVDQRDKVLPDSCKSPSSGN